MLAGLFLIVMSAQVGAAQNALKFGTWKLNLEKSKFDPGPPPRSDTRTYEDAGGGLVKSTHTTVSADGKESLTIYAAKFDGREYPVETKGSSTPGSIAFHVVDAYSESFVLKRGGKVATTGNTMVSKDGKTLTITTRSPGAQGRESNNINVYEKQSRRL